MVAFDMQDRRGKLSPSRCATNHEPVGARLAHDHGHTVTPLDAILQLPWWHRVAVWRTLDLVVVNSDAWLLLRVAAELLACGSPARLFGIDILLARPVGWRGHLRTGVARPLLRRVDRFFLHQRDVLALDRLFGIGARCEYVPFKSNVWERLQQGELVPADHGYVLHAGRTHRDLACFVAACWQQAVPTILLIQPSHLTRAHGTTWDGGQIPPWVRVIEDGEDRGSFDRYLAGARLVVVAIRPDTITPTGCSTMLDAMALGKCTIMSDGPATRDIITDGAAVIVPAGDSTRLAEAIGRYYRDADARRCVAQAGLRFARTMEGADRLHDDLARGIVRQMHQLQPQAPHEEHLHVHG